jgi:hypothetical protein
MSQHAGSTPEQMAQDKLNGTFHHTLWAIMGRQEPLHEASAKLHPDLPESLKSLSFTIAAHRVPPKLTGRITISESAKKSSGGVEKKILSSSKSVVISKLLIWSKQVRCSRKVILRR